MENVNIKVRNCDIISPKPGEYSIVCRFLLIRACNWLHLGVHVSNLVYREGILLEAFFIYGCYHALNWYTYI